MSYTIRKIPLAPFINLLTEIYESGADFVDLNGERNEEKSQDEITISVPMEYISQEVKDEILPPPGVSEESEEQEILEEIDSESPNVEDIEGMLNDGNKK